MCCAGAPKYFDDVNILMERKEDKETEPVNETPSLTLQWVQSVASEVIGDLELDEPLTAAGMDSLSAVELRRKLSQKSGKALPSTLAFDYPSVRAIAQHLVPSRVFSGATGATLNGTSKLPVSASVAGKACRIPGHWTQTSQEAWSEVFQRQLDAVTEIPLLRFDVNECFDGTAAGVGFLTYSRHASAIDGIDTWTCTT